MIFILANPLYSVRIDATVRCDLNHRSLKTIKNIDTSFTILMTCYAMFFPLKITLYNLSLPYTKPALSRFNIISQKQETFEPLFR